MAIYTKTGDSGTTGVFGGKRVSKASLQIETTGSIDELTTYIGYVREEIKTKREKNLLEELQKDLYRIMAVVAGANIPIVYLVDRTKEFEQEIDNITSKLPKLTSFILPGGTREASLFHILRVMTRKTERTVVELNETSKSRVDLPTIIQYLNRLSDLFFTMSRQHAKGRETPIKL